MDARQFLAEFGHITLAPEGVQRLRELVLSLAVRGKLVTLNNQEGDGSELFGLVAEQLAEQQHRKRGRSRSNLQSNETPLPYTLPESWCWAPLCEVASCITDGSHNPPRDAGSGHPMLSSQNILNGSIDFLSPSRFLSERDFESEDKRTQARPGDVLLTIVASLGRSAVVPKTAQAFALQRSVAVVKSPMNPYYLSYVFRSPLSQAYFNLHSKGTAQKGIYLGKLAEMPIPFPSLAEQSRIVAKVDELMGLCDKLEAQQQERDKVAVAARKAVLGDLTNVNTVSFSPAWERLDQSIGSLFVTPEAVDDFEATLKDLAVRGLLTPTTGMLPDVAAITQSCAGLRNKYIAAQWMRKQKLIIASDSTVEYPSNWEVVPFDEVAVVIGGVTKGRDLRGREVIICPYLSVANVQRSYFKLEGIKTIEIAAEELGKYGLNDGDLMITEGGDWDKVGRTAIWRGGIENCLHQNHVFKARVPSNHLLNEWVELVFNSNVGRDYFAGASKQTTNLASINMTQLRSFPLPIPPLVEQKAILEKLSTMLATCKTWRGQREQAQKLSALLASASVSAITGVRIEEEEEELKAPKTELISNLRLGESPSIKEQAPLAAILARQNGEMNAKDLWQRFGGEIDAFYGQLKLEVDKGWIREPEEAVMRIQERA